MMPSGVNRLPGGCRENRRNAVSVWTVSSAFGRRIRVMMEIIDLKGSKGSELLKELEEREGMEFELEFA